MDKKPLIFKFALSAFIVLFISCNDVMLTAPVSDNADNSANVASSLLAPTGLSATNGGYRRIDLSWTSVKGAKRYFVYAAQDPSEPFKQIWETSSVSFKDESGSGKIRYYKVVAENYAGVKSAFSTFVLGSSLAKPVITSIDMDDEGSAASVSWWMENCESFTYQNKINYTVTVYSEDKTTVVKTVPVSSGREEVLIEGLTPNTAYYFEVEAYCTDSQTEAEKSDLIDERTARLLIPAAPQDFTAECGLNETEVELSWILPEYVDVKTGTDTYERRPLYFKIFRKEEGKEDSEYKEIVSYLGSVLEGDEANKKYKLDCSANSSSSARLSVIASQDSNAEKSNLYSYISLSKISYRDNSELKRGVKYSYKIQSYVDDISKTVSSKKSCSQATGWLIGVASLRSHATYTKSEDDTKFLQIDIGFNANFDSIEKNYSYVLKQTKTDFYEANPTETATVFSSIDELKSYVKTFDNPVEDSGYYRYSLLITSTDDSSQIYTMADSLGKIIVTDDASGIPVIENFSVEDGYSNKFKISFSYDSSYMYTLKWKDIIDGIGQSEQSLLLEDEHLQILATTANFEHQAPSGVRREYSLEVENSGISIEAQVDGVFETLGTADIKTHSPLYDRIIFEWKAVQKADAYEVKAFYTDEPSNPFTILESDIVVGSDTLVCTINEPVGWRDAKFSGKEITIEVVAKNSNTGDTTSGQTHTSTLGPALAEAVFYSNGRDFIKIRWQAVAGAKGYAIARARCSDGTSSKIESLDTYFVSADGSVINIEGEQVDSLRAEVLLKDSFFTLTDKYAETTATETSQISYKKNQSKICWGVEYRYSVIPVLSEDDFVFELEDSPVNVVLSPSSKVMYENISFVSAGAIGYGLEVRASKATSPSYVTITWKQPFGVASTAKTPSIYSRKSGDSNATWTFAGYAVSSSESVMTTQIIPKDATTAYDFAVVYNNFSEAVSLFPSYEESLNSVFDEVYSPEETLNKGYAFALQGVYAAYVEGFTEQISWNSYDFDKRKVGPERYEIQIKNLNSSKGWVTIADIGVDLKNSDYGSVADISKYSDTAKIDLVKNGDNILQIKPVFDLNDTNTSGVLKVLRDYKHYYRLVGIRSVDGSPVEATVGDNDTFAYRNVTDEELAKSALLALSYAFFINDGGKEDLTNAGNQFKYGDAHTLTTFNGGKAVFTKGSYYWVGTYIGKYYADYTLTNYAPNQLTPGGTSAEFLSLTSGTGSKNTFNMKGSSDYYLYSFLETNVINIEAAKSDLPISYTASISFTATTEKDFSLNITRGGVTKTLVTTSNAQERKTWFPMQINPENKYEIKSATLGWWED